MNPPAAEEDQRITDDREPKRQKLGGEEEQEDHEEGDHEQEKAGEGSSEGKQKYQKKKVALILSYCGLGYQGMQINPGAKTIEADLFQAIIKAGGVSEANAHDQKKVHLQRAARTDKGVHAAGQVVCMKLLMKPNILEEINSFLPPQIRIFAIKKVTNTFHAKNFCNARIYEYLIPTYLFQRGTYHFEESEVAEAEKSIHFLQDNRQELVDRRKAKKKKGEESESEGEGEDEPFKEAQDTPEKEEIRKAFRLSEEEHARLNEVLKSYVGTHNYHNFTSKKKPNDPSANRFITFFVAEKPFLHEGLEWVSLKVKGQSFMLHQIRKMIGLTVAVMRTGVSPSLISTTFAPEKKHIPVAPAVGLFLNQICYDTYNQKMEDERKIDVPELQEEMEAFKRKHIFTEIIAQETKGKAFLGWLNYFEENLLNFYPFLFRKNLQQEQEKLKE